MLVLASFNPTNLSGLGPIVSVGVLIFCGLGLIATFAIAAFFISETLDERRFQPERFGFDPRPVDRGTALPCWCNEDALKGVASQHGVDGTPVKVEKKSSLGIRIGLPWGARGKADGSTKVVRKPFDDLGELIFQVLARLDKKGELNRTADRVFTQGMRMDPVLAALAGGRENAEQFFTQWLSKHYPNGLQVSSEELATELAGIGDEILDEELRQLLEEAHQSLADSDGSIILLEGEWRVGGEEGNLLLERTDLQIMTTDDSEPKSFPMPSGVSIHVRLDGELTRHGKNSMLGVTRPVRGGVVGTVRQREPTTGCLEITPIAVFQRA